jgi:hypothetical protein
MGYTPGPWEYSRIGPRTGPVRLTDKTFKITPSAGPAFAYLPEGRDDIQLANSRLISAAPDLLKAVQALLYSMTDEGEHTASAASGLARAALLKAMEP